MASAYCISQTGEATIFVRSLRTGVCLLHTKIPKQKCWSMLHQLEHSKVLYTVADASADQYWGTLDRLTHMYVFLLVTSRPRSWSQDTDFWKTFAALVLKCSISIVWRIGKAQEGDVDRRLPWHTLASITKIVPNRHINWWHMCKHKETADAGM